MKKIRREAIEWCDIWITGAEANRLPRVLLVGDSIARSYFAEVEKALQGKFLCARLATSKCLCDPSFRKELQLVLDDYVFAVIHFNNGLHGADYDERSYRKDFAGTMRFIRMHAKDSALIWANSTPVRKNDNLAALAPFTKRVRERNRMAMEFAVTHRIPINDLFSLVENHPEYFASDGVHFNADGQAVLGRQVARSILRL
jgi:hypothetical protein